MQSIINKDFGFRVVVMEKRVNRFIKLYPWYKGLTGDLLFYVAIGTLFLRVVRGLTSAELVTMTTVSTVAAIALQFPMLWVIKRVGNTVSVRISGIALVMSALCFTFGTNFYVIILGAVFRNISQTMCQPVFVALENNLDLVNRRDEFIKIRASGNTCYSVLTMIVSFIASPLFNVHRFLPMLCCIASTVIGLIMSFFMADCSGSDIITFKAQKSKAKVGYGKLVLLAVLSYGVFFALVNEGQTDQKLFIEGELMSAFSVDNAALILGIILAVSRIIRVVSNMVFVKIYSRMKQTIGNLLASLMFASFVLSVLGSLAPNTIVKFTIMALGYVIILFCRDPFTLYIQDIIFENAPKEQHQTLLTMLRFGVKLATAALGIVASMLLLKFPFVVVIAILGIFAIAEIVISVWLYKTVKASQKESCEVQ